MKAIHGMVVMLAAGALLAAGESGAQYADQVRQVAPESVQTGADRRPLQIKRVAPASPADDGEAAGAAELGARASVLEDVSHRFHERDQHLGE